MKSFYLRGYVPQDGEHIMLDEKEYIAHEEPRTKNQNGFWEQHCPKCAFDYNGYGTTNCPVFNSKDVSCAMAGRGAERFVYFTEATE